MKTLIKILQIIWKHLRHYFQKSFPAIEETIEATNEIVQTIKPERRKKHVKTVKKLKYYLDINQNLRK